MEPLLLLIVGTTISTQGWVGGDRSWDGWETMPPNCHLSSFSMHTLSYENPIYRKIGREGVSFAPI